MLVVLCVVCAGVHPVAFVLFSPSCVFDNALCKVCVRVFTHVLSVNAWSALKVIIVCMKYPHAIGHCNANANCYSQ